MVKLILEAAMVMRWSSKPEIAGSTPATNHGTGLVKPFSPSIGMAVKGVSTDGVLAVFWCKKMNNFVHT